MKYNLTIIIYLLVVFVSSSNVYGACTCTVSWKEFSPQLPCDETKQAQYKAEVKWTGCRIGHRLPFRWTVYAEDNPGFDEILFRKNVDATPMMDLDGSATMNLTFKLWCKNDCSKIIGVNGNSGNKDIYILIDRASFSCNTKPARNITCANCSDQNSDNDSDSDGILDYCDNCINIYNPSQLDFDNDFIGDECDFCPNDIINDPDEDGICGINDNCPYFFNPSQIDSDNDNVGDECDFCVNNPIINNYSTFPCNFDACAGDLESWNGNSCLCEFNISSISGCTDSLAINYNPNANCDDNSCNYSVSIPTLSQWGIMILALLLLIIGTIGIKNQLIETQTNPSKFS